MAAEPEGGLDLRAAPRPSPLGSRGGWKERLTPPLAEGEGALVLAPAARALRAGHGRIHPYLRGHGRVKCCDLPLPFLRVRSRAGWVAAPSWETPPDAAPGLP